MVFSSCGCDIFDNVSLFFHFICLFWLLDLLIRCFFFNFLQDDQRSRSRSPVHRHVSDERSYGGNQREYGYSRSRGGYGGRYEGRRSDFGRGDFTSGRGRGRGRGGFRDDGRRGRFRAARGDYGPVLARELDSTYDEKVNRNYGNSIFVGNLTYDCTPEDLKDHFSEIGEVVRADIITSRGHHRGMGTVEYTNSEDVDEAIRKFDASYFMDRQVFVRQDNPPPESSRERLPVRQRSGRAARQPYPDQHQQPQATFEVFVANLPYSINWQALKDMFKECGRVIRADVEMDRNGYSRGFGTVIYGTLEEMEEAIQRYNGYELEGRPLDVRQGRNIAGNERKEPFESSEAPVETEPAAVEFTTSTAPPSGSEFTKGVTGSGERSSLIYCANLPFSTATSDLYDLFETIGKVINAELTLNADGSPTGIAVVEYANIEDADVCIERLNNYNYGGCDLDISYAKRN